MSQNEIKKESVIMGSATTKSLHPAFKYIEDAYNAKQARLKEKYELAGLQSPITGETQQMTPETRVTSEITKSFEYFAPIDWMRRFSADSNTFVIPIIGTGSVALIGGGVFATGASIATGANVNLTNRYGSTINWTRDYPLDCGYDVVSEQLRVNGEAFASHRLGLAIGFLTGGCVATSPFYTGAAGAQATWVSSGSTGITIANVNTLIRKYKGLNMGSPDFMLVNHSVYHQLLALEEFTSNLYNPGNAMSTGVLDVPRFGIKVYEVDGLSRASGSNFTTLEAGAVINYIIVGNSKKTIALVERGGIKVEPYETPKTDEYGLIASGRYTIAPLVQYNVCSGAAWIGLQSDTT